jgi:small conductance mechanosensitive channel
MPTATTPEFAEKWPEWARWLIGAPLQIVVILIAAVVLVAVLRAVIRKVTRRLSAAPARVLGAPAVNEAYANARKEARMKTLGSVGTSVVSVAVWILAICLILERCGVNIGLIITSIGVVGVAIGLGAQTLIKDMVAGIFMIIEDQFGVGDVIDAGPATGKVEAVTLRVTTLRDADGVLWYIPNGTVTRIGNKTQLEQATGGSSD